MKMSTSYEEINSECESQHSFPYYLTKKKNRRRSSLIRRECRLVRRLVRKSGKSSVYQEKQRNRLYRYFRDLSNTLINSHWHWILLLLSFAFILIWFVFAFLWMLIATENDDYNAELEEQCLIGIKGFRGYLLFSIETQSSIGYGTRSINHYCPEAIFLMCLQVGTGICIGGSLICIVYSKMIGPNRLHSLNCFSKHAVINQRDGILSLIFRIRDSGGRYECQTKVSAFLVQKRKEQVFLKSIKLDPVGILIWPVEVVHRINETSPFWDLSAKDLIIKRFEIILEIEGTSSSRSIPSKTMTSYLGREILWGHRFKPCISYDKEKQTYIVSSKLFNKTEETLTPLCSAKRLREVLETIPNVKKSPNISTDRTSVIVNIEEEETQVLKKKIFSISSSSSSSGSEDEREFTCEGFCTKQLSADDLYKSLEQFVIENKNDYKNRGKKKSLIDKHHITYNETDF